MRKHATGKAKIELHVLSVERGLSWEGAQEKWAELTGIDEGFYLANQVSYIFESRVLKVLTFEMFFEFDPRDCEVITKVTNIKFLDLTVILMFVG